MRFVRDATVSGSGRWRPSNGEHHGSLVVRRDGADPIRVRLDWRQRSREATARIGDATLALPAP